VKRDRGTTEERVSVGSFDAFAFDAHLRGVRIQDLGFGIHVSALGGDQGDLPTRGGGCSPVVWQGQESRSIRLVVPQFFFRLGKDRMTGSSLRARVRTQ
jgi:hypothetical protein